MVSRGAGSIGSPANPGSMFISEVLSADEWRFLRNEVANLTERGEDRCYTRSASEVPTGRPDEHVFLKSYVMALKCSSDDVLSVRIRGIVPCR